MRPAPERAQVPKQTPNAAHLYCLKFSENILQYNLYLLSCLRAEQVDFSRIFYGKFNKNNMVDTGGLYF